MRDLSKALGYCRVSTQRQHTEGHGLERYIDRLKQYGLTEAQIYWDIESGSSEKREGYNKVLEKVRLGQVDQIIVPCFDRFTRSALGWEVARQELQMSGVELVFLDGGSLDLETPEGLFTSRILAAMAAQVRDKNRYNSIQGHRFFQEKRKIYQAIFGLKKDGDTVKPNLDPYKETGLTVRDVALEIIELFLDTGNLSATIEYLCNSYGYDRHRIKHLDFPRSPSSLKRWLENPLICGRIRYYAEEKDKTLILDSDHEGIIDLETFNQISALLERNAAGRRHNQANPLVSLCYCGHCGRRMRKITLTRSDRNQRYHNEYLQCLGAKNRAGKEIICDYKKFYRYEDAIASVIKALTTKASAIASDLDRDEEIQVPSEIIELQKEIIKLKALNDSDYQPVIVKKEQKLETLIRGLESNAESTSRRYEEYLEVLQIRNSWDKLSRSELTPIFQDLIAKVVCSTKADGTHCFSVDFNT
ncbi:fdxN element excision recombinase XisF [Calothrix sp. UHCC 0171]|uniref:fdxN element excision recombinase XisF n=1 Tax=Calothrix sp. UHCC 0171 TaxID=3110245 RepID=UPI002B205F52|nr:fdxN element excision recombinase XisF [Calothrix sp. UHCC 0171]MEA5573583.1 fdxN element excision recombinase XisF [Calothrix sp. UHCC 0171]